MTTLVPMVGKKCGMLLVTRRGESNKSGQARWECLCDCGKTTLVEGRDLRTGHTISCGCHRLRVMADLLRKHGGVGSDEYRAWLAMKDRCYNKNNYEYLRYGGRGISVCNRWRKNFANFRQDMGARPSKKYSLNRVDNNEGYGPDNCNWATMKEQARNTRRTRYVSVNGRVGKLAEMAEEMGVKYSTLKARAKRQSFGTRFVAAPSSAVTWCGSASSL